jgi:uncharacterized protein YcbK (DUF882 family)
MKTKRRFKPVIRRHPLLRADVATALVALCAALGVIQFYRPDAALGRTPFAHLGGATLSLGSASGNAFGRSGEVKLLFALPGEKIEFPLAVGGDPTALTYEWTSLRGTETGFATQPVEGADIATPSVPGFYYLTLIRGGDRQIINQPTVAIMRPFREKLGAMLNGYRIGTYLAEKLRGVGDKEHPDGFLEVYPQHLDLAISKHLKIRDFITHDDQSEVWPKYIALNPRLLDKLELVFSDLGSRVRPGLAVDMHSGFRSPSHNSRVENAARDSRHMYGDAADLAVDADGDGRITMTDELLVMLAVERVEERNPDLVGGLGLYTSRRFRTPYVHIDARGTRTRWQG